MFQRARTRWRPPGIPLTVCDTVCGGCAPPLLKEAMRVPLTKYSQFVVAWQAVQYHVKVAELPMLVTGQASEWVSRTENEPPPLHNIEPLGASTLCGSYFTWP